MSSASCSRITLAVAGVLTTFAAAAPHAAAVDGDLPDDPEPTVAFSLLDAGSVVEGDSGTKEVTWVVASALPATEDCTVEVVFEPASSTADPGTDVGVDAVSGVLISEGSTSAGVPGEVIGDELIEPDETVTVSLRSASISGFPGCPVVEGATSMLVIRDDDRPALSVTGQDVVEGNSGTRTMPFTISAAAPGKDDCELGLRLDTGHTSRETLGSGPSLTPATADDADVVVPPGGFSRVVLAHGTTSLEAAVIVRGDVDVEDDELVTLTVVQVPGNDLPDCTLSERSGSALILNDDEPIVEEPPATEPPTTEAPTTEPPTTEPPTTSAAPATTAAPTTEAPTTTGAPTTAPITVATTQAATTVPEVLALGPVTTAPLPVVSGQLPTTGGDSSALTTLGTLAVLAGALTLLVARLRRGRRTA